MLERLRRRLELTENDRDALLADLLEEAEQYILGYTGRWVYSPGYTRVRRIGR